MTFQIKKIITENPIIKLQPKELASSNMSKSYHELDGEKSSTEGFICRDMYIAIIDELDEEVSFFKRFL